MFIGHVLFVNGDGVGFFVAASTEEKLDEELKGVLVNEGKEPAIVAEVNALGNLSAGEWVTEYHSRSENSLLYSGERTFYS